MNKENEEIKLTESELQTIGRKFKKIREKNKLTQKELAENIGVSEITIRRYEY